MNDQSDEVLDKIRQMTEEFAKSITEVYKTNFRELEVLQGFGDEAFENTDKVFDLMTEFEIDSIMTVHMKALRGAALGLMEGMLSRGRGQ